MGAIVLSTVSFPEIPEMSSTGLLSFKPEPGFVCADDYQLRSLSTISCGLRLSHRGRKGWNLGGIDIVESGRIILRAIVGHPVPGRVMCQCAFLLGIVMVSLTLIKPHRILTIRTKPVRVSCLPRFPTFLFAVERCRKCKGLRMLEALFQSPICSRIAERILSPLFRMVPTVCIYQAIGRSVHLKMNQVTFSVWN